MFFLIPTLIAGVVGFITGGWTFALILGGLTLISTLMMPKPKGMDMKPASLSDFSITQANEGSPIPIVYGQVKIPSNIIWYGNLVVEEIKQEAGGGSGGGGSEEVVVGYKYYIDIWHSICQGKVKLIEVYKNDKPFNITQNKNYLTNPNSINPFKLLVGTIIPYNGDTANYYIFNDGTMDDHPTKNDTGIPDWIETRLPNVAHIFFKKFYVGNNTYVPVLHFLIRRDLSDIRLPYQDIVDTANDIYYGNNPASVIYDLLVNQLQMSENIIDMNSFIAASNYYNQKKYGINLVISSETNVWDEISNILSLVDSFLYVNSEGKISIKIIKDDDTSVGTIQDDFIEFNLTKQSISEIPNTYKANIVKDGVIHTIEIENPALKGYLKNEIILKSFDLTMFRDENVAMQKLYDFVKKYSYPFAILQIKVPAKYSIYNLGDVITIINSENGINSNFRILEIKEQNIDKNEIEMTLIQHKPELFDQHTNVYTPQDSYYTPLNPQVQPINNIKVIEINEYENTFVVCVPKTTGYEAGYHIYISDDNLNFEYLKTCTTFCNRYQLKTNYPNTTYDIDDTIGIELTNKETHLTFTSITRQELFSKERYVVIDDELMKFQNINAINENTTKLDGILRATHFTSKQSHTAGSNVYVGYISDNVFTTKKENFYIKIVPFNSWMTVMLEDLQSIHIVKQNKYLKPEGIQRVYANADSNGNVKIDVFIKVKYDLIGAGKKSADTYTDEYPFPTEGELLVSLDNWNTYTVYNNFNIELNGITYPKTIYLKQKLNSYTSDSVSIIINGAGDYVKNY